jgi:hypothetical protein
VKRRRITTARTLSERLQHAWNAFRNRDPASGTIWYPEPGYSYNIRPDRVRYSTGNERSIIASIYTRIALDASTMELAHVRLDQNGRYKETMPSGLNECLTIEANIDQTGRNLLSDIVISMFDEGSVAVVPVDTTLDPSVSGSYEIHTLRTGKILQWYPSHVRVRVYNEKTGQKEELILPKKMVAIIENPLYSVMNEPNSTLKRLIHKLNLLDAIDEQSGSGKLDLIIQLPYTIKSEAKREQAENRRKDIEVQLAGSKYGIAYADATEKITQLNRPAENNLMKQIEYLTSMLYSQLGITDTILNGSANEETMLNYYNRTIEPLLTAIVEEMRRKFLTKTARTQQQTIMFFRNPFKLVPISQLAEIADKMTRNEILSSNEIRAIMGYKPSDDPKADKLLNKNLNQVEAEANVDEGYSEEPEDDKSEKS